MWDDCFVQGQLCTQIHLPKHPIGIGGGRPTQHKSVVRHDTQMWDFGPVQKVVVQRDLREPWQCEKHQRKTR